MLTPLEKIDLHVQHADTAHKLPTSLLCHPSPVRPGIHSPRLKGSSHAIQLISPTQYGKIKNAVTPNVIIYQGKLQTSNGLDAESSRLAGLLPLTSAKH